MQKKFGTFSGVLTPSLLTILGVIMYMRLGTVVGYSNQIFEFILIIVFAHLISITTGLSVSSISTDKKIEKGGIYYMLTRSLGLPIGGAIGLTIFVATALSISLYLIGFAESLIPVLGFDVISINGLRIFGTIALLLVLIIAYISTSFALKIQYVILGLIVLSLFSIFLGNSDNVSIGTDKLDNPSFSVLFGIFFPAVTGFTAGVAMSGDLKRPRLSIPWGTLLAIFIGFVVYITLSIFIFYNIDSTILQSNNNALIEFGAIPLLVIGGVWGATLSSALGGILGGPRILQAMSLDRITPKVFSKGYGVNNEPRNALFLTFFIAEFGILIGELNVIAELVAMFYMAAYLFINVSCFLEQWSSPDFRPKFKIPIWVSLTGAISTFLLMIQLNLAATLVAVLVMLLVFLWLSRKDLVLGTGDVWTSVWTSIVKTALKNLHKKSPHKRNWQPNILLFSGGSNERPYLIEFSKSISGRGGMVSNFDLIEKKSADVLFPKSNQIVKDNQVKDDSIFHRKLYCQNTFKGIESIANTYGFSGIDPNTILMGWAKNTKDPIWFAQMTKKLNLLDYNLLYLDYDKSKGFGEYSSVDIWWTKLAKENELSLQLVKFLKNSKIWKSASVRLCFVNNKKVIPGEDLRKINDLIDKMRLPIKLELINNSIEKKSLNDLLKIYSFKTDLIITDLPKLKPKEEESFVKKTNELLNQIGSTLFIDASSKFINNSKDLVEIVIDEKVTNKNLVDRSKIFVTKDDNLDNVIRLFYDAMSDINSDFINKVKTAYSSQYNFYDKCFKNTKGNNELIKELKNSPFFIDLNQKFEKLIFDSVDEYFIKLITLINQTPNYIRIKWNDKILQKNVFINSRLKRKKQKILNDLAKGKIVYSKKVYLKNSINHHLNHGFSDGFSSILLSIGSLILSHHQLFKLSILEGTLKKSYKTEMDKKIIQDFNELQIQINTLSQKLVNSIIKDVINLDYPNIAINREEDFNPKNFRKKSDKILNFPYWMNANNNVIHQHKILNVSASIFYSVVLSKINFISNNIKEEIVAPLKNFSDKAVDLIKSNDADVLEELIVEIQNHLVKYNESYFKNYNNIDFQKEMMEIPDELSVYDLKTLNNFHSFQTKLPIQIIYPKNTFFSIYNKEIAPIIKDLISDEFQTAKLQLEKILSSLQLIVFTLNNQSDTNVYNDVVDKAKNTSKDIFENLELTLSRFEVSIHKLKDKLTKISEVDFIMLNNTKKAQFSNIDTSQNSGLMNRIKTIQTLFSDKMISVLNIISPKVDNRLHIGFSNRMDKLRSFVDSVSLNEVVKDRIPLFYSQLFSGYHQPNEFYSSFVKSQLNQMESAFFKMKKHKQNVLVVSGNPLSGKTYLINQFLENNPKSNFFHIYPPSNLEFDGVENIIPKLFNDVNGEIKSIKSLNDLPTNSIVVLEDFELWWRKSENGFDKIHQWISIFKKHSEEMLFIIECNHYLIDMLLKITQLNKVLIQVVETPYYSGNQVNKIIKYKNKLANQTINYKGSDLNDKPFVTNFLLFNQLANLSGGNIGWLNSVWISSLKADDRGELSFAPNFDLVFPPIDDAEENLIILLLLQHKKLTKIELEKLLFHLSLEEINSKISLLGSEKLIVFDSEFIMVNPVILSYLIKYFKEKEMLKV